MSFLQWHDGKKGNFPSSSVAAFDNLDHRLSLLSRRLRDPAMQHKARKNKCEKLETGPNICCSLWYLYIFIAMRERWYYSLTFLHGIKQENLANISANQEIRLINGRQTHSKPIFNGRDDHRARKHGSNSGRKSERSLKRTEMRARSVRSCNSPSSHDLFCTKQLISDRYWQRGRDSEKSNKFYQRFWKD